MLGLIFVNSSFERLLKIKDAKCIINADGDIQNNPKIMKEWIATVKAFVMC